MTIAAGWWTDTTLGADLGICEATTDEVYAAMDWLLSRQDAVESKLAARHLSRGGLALFDLSSAWLEGHSCPLGAFGYSRDGKKNRAQIEFGMVASRAGIPVAVRVFAGNTSDSVAFGEIIPVVRDKFGLDEVIMVGDRGSVTKVRIGQLKAHSHGHLRIRPVRPWTNQEILVPVGQAGQEVSM